GASCLMPTIHHRAPLLFAEGPAGLRLPVIDVTHPAFTVTIPDEELATMARRFVDEQPGTAPLPPAVAAALERSLLGGHGLRSAGTFLRGIGTYLFKLGPDNEPGAAHEIDRRIASSFPALSMRVRLQDIADLLASGLAARLDVDDGRPLLCVNLGGGPAADTLNALIVA